MKRLLSLLLCITLTVSMLPLSAFAEDIPAVNSYEIYMDSSALEALPEEDRLFAGYMHQLIYGDVSTFGTAAREYLNTTEQSVYTWLKNRIVNVAANGGSTEILLTPDKITDLDYTWPTGTDVLAQFEAQVDMNKVWSALVHDCPYDLYWFDKNRQGPSLGITTTDNGTDVSISQLTFIMPVSMNWRPNPTYSTTVTANVENVKSAATNAAAIVSKHADKDDYSRLLAYKDEICALTDYNSDEITDGIEYVNNSSWQLINVFDGNPDTKVVSEGYARAFQYLCDLSVFDTAKCYTVYGTLDGISHGWNLVTMEDGYTYLVDITNSDTGTAGQYGQYFMTGYDDGGRWSGFVVNGRRYSYVSGILFDIDTLTLAPKDYIYPPRGTVHFGQCGDNAYWFLNENGTLTIDGWGDMWSDYYISNQVNNLPEWYRHQSKVKNLVIEEGITSVGNYNFYHFRSLETVSFPQTLKSIGENAFYTCDKIRELIIPDSVTSIGTAAFGNLWSATKIKLSENLTKIPAWAFAYCSAVEEIEIPDGVKSIGDHAFYCCEKLKKVIIPASVTTIGESAFYQYPDCITDVYYGSSKSRWEKIGFGLYNECLTDSEIHFSVTDDNEVVRIKGKTRYETSFAIATETKAKMGVDKFGTVIIASGENFADALAGSYLAKVKNAPILMTNGKNNEQLKAYISANLNHGGTVYILGGTAAVPQSTEDILTGFNVKRLKGKTRYDTNIEILKEAGVTNQDILVATGTNFADSLSASAVGKPILLVDGKKELTQVQKDYLNTLGTEKFYIVGGTGAVAEGYETALTTYGSVERVKGKSRYETSVAIAERFFASPDYAVVAYAENFPDGLCGGPLAMTMDAPLILTKTGKQTAAKGYMQTNGINSGAVLGGASLIDDATAKAIFGVNEIIVK